MCSDIDAAQTQELFEWDAWQDGATKKDVAEGASLYGNDTCKE